MTNYIKKLLASITLAGVVLVTPALAADRTDCVASLTAVIDGNQKSEVAKDFKAVPIPPEETSAILAKKGPPPVAEPYTFSLMTAVVDDEPIGMLVIHDGDCILLGLGPYPLEKINAVLGRIGA